jgi:hypothetical protein
MSRSDRSLAAIVASPWPPMLDLRACAGQGRSARSWRADRPVLSGPWDLGVARSRGWARGAGRADGPPGRGVFTFGGRTTGGAHGWRPVIASTGRPSVDALAPGRRATDDEPDRLRPSVVGHLDVNTGASTGGGVITR